MIVAATAVAAAPPRNIVSVAPSFCWNFKNLSFRDIIIQA